MKNQVAKRITQLRTELKFNLKKFSDESEITYSLLSKIESGAVQPSQKVIEIICRRWSVPEIWLQEGKGQFSFENKPKADPLMRLESKVDILVANVTYLLNAMGKDNAFKSAGDHSVSLLKAA